MAKLSKIRWSDKDENELKRLVKNFNAKVERLKTKEPLLEDLRPEKISYKDIRKNIDTRQDLNRQLNKLQRFGKRGSEEIIETKSGVVTTKYQFNEAVILQRTVTAKRRAKREKGGEAVGVVADKPKVSEIKPSGFEKYLESLQKEVMSRFDEQRKQMYLDNYITAVSDNLGIYGQEIITFVRSIPIDVFIQNSLTNPYLEIDFVYGEEGQQMIADAILQEWQRVAP